MLTNKKRPRLRTAVVGGDGRRFSNLNYGPETRVFPAPKYGGDIRTPKTALRAGRIDRVVLLVRLVDHPTSEQVKRLCRRLGMEVTRFTSGAIGGDPPDPSNPPDSEEE